MIVALGGSLFMLFILTPTLQEALEPPARLQVVAGVIRRFAAVALSALGVLIITGLMNLANVQHMTAPLAIKLALVVVVVILNLLMFGVYGLPVSYMVAGRMPLDKDRITRNLDMLRRLAMANALVVLVIVYLSVFVARGMVR